MDTKVTQLQGGKEIGLFELEKHSHLGYSVPRFFVLPNLGNEKELIKIAEEFKGCDIIVRSNSIMENSEFGFDGIYESIVLKNWDIDSFNRACKNVLESILSEDAIAYRSNVGIEEDSMRVIVQKFIGKKDISNDEELQYFVMETSINSQGDRSIVIDENYEFINAELDYEEIIADNNGNILTSTDILKFISEHKLLEILKIIATELQKVFGPVSLEGAYLKNIATHDIKVFLFQRRLLAKEFYQAKAEVVPDKYDDKDILFRSKTYRGAGKIENLPLIVMPTINHVKTWEDDLRKKITQLNSDVILFVPTMHLGEMSSRILNDYRALSGVRAIISFEKIDFASHAFKVASLARIPFVSVKKFDRIKTLSRGSLFFTKNQAVFCLDEKRDEFKFDLLKKSEATSLAKLIKEKGIVVRFSEEKQELGFDLNTKKFSFNDLEISFHRLLEDVSGEAWLFGNDNFGSIGFKCENSKGHIIQFSGWGNYLFNEGHLNLDNFREHFEDNKVEWSLIQAIFAQLNG